MSLQIGSKAPNISLPDQDGTLHTLSKYKGKWVLLYFYPKDSTPGCTTEACSLRDSFAAFTVKNAIVLGVSADSVESHKKFVKKYRLPFTLLSDTKKKAVQVYGVWREKSFMGRTFMAIHRMSYLVDPKGKIAKVYEKVKPQAHSAEVLQDIQDLSKSV